MRILKLSQSLAPLFVGMTLLGSLAQADIGKPSLYHTPVVGKQTCAATALQTLKAEDGSALAQLCPAEYRKCLIQGSCLIQKEDGSELGVNFRRYDSVREISTFDMVDISACPFGYGFGSLPENRTGLSCLIPYQSVAVDALEHHLGKVLFVPKLVGVQLPDGSLHDGYLVVTDYSEGINGAGANRFVLFTGHKNHRDADNVFVVQGLDNIDSTFEYAWVDESEAKLIRERKGFKLLKTFKARIKPIVNPHIQ